MKKYLVKVQFTDRVQENIVEDSEIPNLLRELVLHTYEIVNIKWRRVYETE